LLGRDSERLDFYLARFGVGIMKILVRAVGEAQVASPGECLDAALRVSEG